MEARQGEGQTCGSVFRTTQGAFDRIWENPRTTRTEIHIELAGYPTRLRIVGRELADEIRRAFRHLQTGKVETPALRIDFWDEEESGSRSYRLTNGAVGDPTIALEASEDGRYIGAHRDQGLIWLDRAAHRIVACTRSAKLQYLDERARPLHKVLSAWLDDRGVQFIHAGLIAAGGKGVLFVGNGGAGKSTSSIACLRGGLTYLGDDLVGIEQTADGFVGHGVFANSLLNVDHLRRFPDLAPCVHQANHENEDKSVLYLSDLFPERIGKSVPVRALVLPRVVDSPETTYRPASKIEALKALAPTSVMFLTSPSAGAMNRLAALVDELPSFWLELGRDIERIPACVERLTEELNA